MYLTLTDFRNIYGGTLDDALRLAARRQLRLDARECGNQPARTGLAAADASEIAKEDPSAVLVRPRCTPNFGPAWTIRAVNIPSVPYMTFYSISRKGWKYGLAWSDYGKVSVTADGAAIADFDDMPAAMHRLMLLQGLS